MGVHSWMFEEIDRERMLDMDRRVAPVRRNALAVLGVALLLSAPWLGWWTLAPFVLAVALFQIADRQARSVAHPEYVIFGAWVGSELIVASSVALSGGPKVATMAWLAIPVVTLPARFSARGVSVGVAIALGLLLAVSFATDAHAVIRNPPLLIAPAALIVAVAMLSMALMRSDIEHRGECVIDGLTGLLNRKALASRAEELAQQSEITGEPVGLIAGDIDCFKAINDRDGHVAGDAALERVAARLRARLRAFDLLYRLGGDEFVVLLPGANLGESEEVAETLRAVVESESLQNGWPVTMSFGVSASARGELFRYQEVFAMADAALYEAKRRGRGQVCAAGGSDDEYSGAGRSQPALAGAAVGR